MIATCKRHLPISMAAIVVLLCRSAAWAGELPFVVEYVEPVDASIAYYDPGIDSFSLDLRDNATRSDSVLVVVREQAAFELPTYVEFNLLASTRHSGFLPPGTLVDNYLIHFDPERDRIGGTRMHVRLTFDRPILGLITRNRTLRESDAVLGRDASEVLLRAQQARGIDGNDSTVVLSPDGRMIGLNLLVTNYYDQMRIVVPHEFISPLAGDYNDDGIVDSVDYTVWRDNLGSHVTLPGDTTPGAVTPADYDVWRSNFGNVAGGLSAEPAVVPEPQSLLLGLAATLLTLLRRARLPAAVWTPAISCGTD